jgi:hypothetical protein
MLDINTFLNTFDLVTDHRFIFPYTRDKLDNKLQPKPYIKVPRRRKPIIEPTLLNLPVRESAKEWVNVFIVQSVSWSAFEIVKLGDLYRYYFQLTLIGDVSNNLNILEGIAKIIFVEKTVLQDHVFYYCSIDYPKAEDITLNNDGSYTFSLIGHCCKY